MYVMWRFHVCDVTGSRVWCVWVCCARQNVAVCCSVLQCVAACCSVLQCVAVCCSVLQCVAALSQLCKAGTTTGAHSQNELKKSYRKDLNHYKGCKFAETYKKDLYQTDRQMRPKDQSPLKWVSFIGFLMYIGAYSWTYPRVMTHTHIPTQTHFRSLLLV